MKGRSWNEVREEAVERQPWLASQEATDRRAAARAANTARVRGYELAELRKSAGLTQAEVAAALGVSQARVSQIEHRQINSLDMLRAYATVLGGQVSIVVRRGGVSIETLPDMRMGMRGRLSAGVVRSGIPALSPGGKVALRMFKSVLLREHDGQTATAPLEPTA
jgi:DNA-binding XRE family transcriptional regulator